MNPGGYINAKSRIPGRTLDRGRRRGLRHAAGIAVSWKCLTRRICCFVLMALLVVTTLPGSMMRSEAKGSLAEGDSVKTIFLYGLDKNGQQMLLAHLSISDMLDYLNDHFDEVGQVHNYSVIDRYPTTVHQEAQGFSVQGFLDYASENSGIEGLSLNYEEEDTVAFWEIDGSDYDEADTYSYNDLYGVARYNFPLLYANYNINTQSIDNADVVWNERQPEEPLLSITAYSQRYILTGAYAQGDSNLEYYFDSMGYLDTAKSMRLMLPMTQDDFENTRSTASSSRWGICNILLDASCLRDTEASGRVAKPVCAVIDGDADPDDAYEAGYSYFKLSCSTEGASIYYNDASVSSYVPTAPYTPGQEIAVKKVNGAAALRVRAVKDGWTDAGIVTVDDQTAGGTDAVPEGVDAWDGISVDTSWYEGHEDDTSYTITTCSELAGLAELINDGTDSAWEEQSVDGRMVTVLDDKQQTVSFQGKTVYLGADLNLAGFEFEVIGDLKGVWQVSSRGYRDLYKDRFYVFDGTFDGCGHTIYGLNPVSLDGSADAGRRGCCGLFGSVENGTVKDLTVRGLVAGSVENGTGAVAGRAVNSSFINCVNYAKVAVNPVASSSIWGNRAGIVGNAVNCTFSGCVNYGEIAEHGRGIGDGTLESCRNYGEVDGIGIGNGTITGCVNYGDVTDMGIGSGTISSCDNRGAVNGSDTSACCGIGSGEITECLNTGAVNGAGIGRGTLRRCVNAGQAVYGLLYTGEVYDSCNVGETSGGSIACGSTGTVYMSNCYTSSTGSVLEGFSSSQVSVGKTVYYPTGATEVGSDPELDVYKVNARLESVMKSSTFVSMLNQAAGAGVFAPDTAGVHGGYPILMWETGVAFDTGKGSAVAAQILRDGEKAVEPEAPVLEGSRFTGWYVDAEETELYDFQSAVEEPLTLYAGWQTIDYAQADPLERVLTWGADPSSSVTVTWRDDSADAGILQYCMIGTVDAPAAASADWEDAVTCRTEEAIRLGSTSAQYWQIPLNGLDDGSTYAYRVYDTVAGAWSDAKTLTTSNPEAESCAFLYMGDVQHLDGTAETEYRDWGTMLKDAYRANPDIAFGLMGGDMVQSGSDASDWSYLLSYGAGVYGSVPMMPTIGNHESNFTSGKAEWYLNLMDLPKNGPEGFKEEFYSFDYAGVHVTVLNSWALSGEQGIYSSSGELLDEAALQTLNEWILSDMTSDAAANADFRVVLLHHPAYSLAVDEVSSRVLEQWVPILEEGAADLVLCGHQHVYTRSYPMYGGEVNPEKGITYIMGNAGQKYYDNANTEYQEKTIFNTSTYQIFRVSDGVLSMETFDRDGNSLDTWSLASRTEKTEPDEPEEPAEPAFAAHSLLLSGQIGVNFYLDLPADSEVDGESALPSDSEAGEDAALQADPETGGSAVDAVAEEYADSYMKFTVNGETVRTGFDPDHKNSDGTLYGFTCRVNSVQMADTITAVFHYGDGQTVEETYSVKEYVDTFRSITETDPDAFDTKTQALITALADYGHYVQPFLAEARGWQIGTDHEKMLEAGEVTAFTEEDEQTAVEALEQFAVRQDPGESAVEAIGCSLVLDTDTSLCFYLKMKSGFSGEVSARLDSGEELAAEKQADGRYRIVVPGIAAHRLGTEQTITVTADGECAINASALSYANLLMKSETYSDGSDGAQAARKTMTALYRYYAAAASYIGQ